MGTGELGVGLETGKFGIWSGEWKEGSRGGEWGSERVGWGLVGPWN